MQNLLKIAVLGMTISAAFAAQAQQAEEGNWLVRGRAVLIDPANKSSAIPSLAVPKDAIHVSEKWIPEVDVSYFFTKNLAAELILTYPQKHKVKVTDSAIGAFKAGTFYHLPPTLNLQWHFNPDGDFRPYVGAGVNYTLISKEDLSVPGVTGLHLENDSWGGSIQAGFDYRISKSVFLNLDVKKVQIRSDLTNDAGVRVSRVKIDPLLVGIGIGYRF
ncbi:OmpW/AlkL family protein [Propionivibrio soli]|uniref:OmpW/AlkL family protein n=1 Tax=Propionivibrio soli TaxID=2976531 RepID=UPI0021E798ED|nr:OmpW family outer membrane protein [Propionivibrio soli]